MESVSLLFMPGAKSLVTSDDVKRLKQLDQENNRLKKIVAERDLEIEVMKEIAGKLVSVKTRLEQARYAIGRGVIQRRACTLLEVARSGLVYPYKVPKKDAPIIQAMRSYSALYPRFGARRVRVFLRRDGIVRGRDRAARIWASAGLQVPSKKPKKRYRSQYRQPFVATAPNQVWAYDFVFDGCANGEKLKCVTMIDEFTKASLHIDVAGSIRSNRLTQILEKLIEERGCPLMLRSDHGPEFVSIALVKLAAEKGLRNLLIEPGKTWQNGTNESFNGKFRDECLSMNWFYSRSHAKVIIETWRKHYNAVRSHPSLEYQTPPGLVSRWKSESTTGANISR